MKKIITLFSIFLVIFSSCKVAEKQFRQGDYEEAIDITVKKLQRNPDKEDEIRILEEAFKRANANDLEAIRQLNLDGQPDRWEDIHAIYQGIGRRQHKIEPLLPLYIGSEERTAVFDLINVTKEISNAKKNAISFWYADATNKLENGNKYDAREAYAELQKIEGLETNYKDVAALKNKARDEGTNSVVFEVVNNSNSVLPSVIQGALNNIDPSNIGGAWYAFHEPSKNNEYDYKIILSITHIESLPEKITNNHYVETKEVEDGVKYFYDDKGNVAKDSLGNPVTEPKYEIISATVNESWQEKIASVEGQIKYIDNASGRVIKTVPVKGDGIFQNYYATAAGYYEALSPQSKQKIGGKPLPFPADNDLILQAIQVLESVMQDAMNDWNDELLNG